MRPDLLTELLPKLKTDYGLEAKGAWLQKGKCPSCGKKELFSRAENPWVLRCGRSDKCGAEFHVKTLYPEIFDEWSTRHPSTPENPTAAADAFLKQARRLNISHLRGHYSQEQYYDRELKIGSATVRFPLPGGSWWERLIDQPGRFGKKKANFAYGKSYAGEWWQPPALSIATIAAAPELWIAEGIFDSQSLWEHGVPAVSAMSCNNYPEKALARLIEAIAAGPTPLHRPKLVWAFDGNNAGRRYIGKFVKRARAEGWDCGAAMTVEKPSAKPKDWNDLHLVDDDENPRFDKAALDEYRWNGDLLIAASSAEAAKLIALRKGLSGFALDFGGRTYWASVNEARVAEIIAEFASDPDLRNLPAAEKRAIALDDAMTVSEIANCIFAPLYFEMDPIAEEGTYYFQLDFPSDLPSVKSRVSAAQIVASADFSKRLAALSPAAVFTGSTYHLQHMRKRWGGIQRVESTYVTGYVREHGAWIFPDHAVKDGKVIAINEEDYFQIGKLAVKPTSSERILDIVWDGGEFQTPWVAPFYGTFGPKGMVALAFWLGTLFAEQIRDRQQSWPFLEVVGEAGSGKSTLFEFLWRLVGRVNYEGFDPSKSTAAARARNLGKVGNLPVVLIESDRADDDRQHSRQFDWDELKTAYNGRSVRSRGVANGGMDTFEPPFRGAIVIGQNDAVNASQAIMERIVHLQFTLSMQTVESRRAIEKLQAFEADTLSGFVIEAVRREKDVLAHYFERFAHHQKTLTGGRNIRLIKNHAQLLASLDALALVIPVPDYVGEATARQIHAMCEERHTAISSDHPAVIDFWERVEHLENGGDTLTPLNHHRDPNLIAISLPQFEERCASRRLTVPNMIDLKKHLKTSKHPKYVADKTVNSGLTHKGVHCWVFQRTPTKPGKD